MQRYFVNNIEKDIINITNSDVHHIRNVMRFKEGDKIEVCNEGILYEAKIKNISKNSVKCEVVKEIKKETYKSAKITLVTSIIKEQNFDIILQKATEIGVFSIIPIITERTNTKLDIKNSDNRFNRWQKIIKEASEQSKRIFIPKLDKIQSINDIIKTDYDVKLFCSLNNDSKSIAQSIKDVTIDSNIVILIGPEGGLSSKEEDILINNKFIPITLGENVLRTETASIYVLSVLNNILRGE